MLRRFPIDLRRHGAVVFIFVVYSIMSTRLSASPALLWHDEFDQPVGSGPDPKKWVHDLGNNGWGNVELENYTDARQNSWVANDPDATDGKVLVIRAVRTGSQYTSARIKTMGKYSTLYGRVEARMKLPFGRGVWPAFWMLGSDIESVPWPACGEIDIMEVPGHEPGKLHGTAHGPGYSGDQGMTGAVTLPNGASFHDAYHIFAVEWSRDRIDWLLDGKVYHTCAPDRLPAGAKWVFNDGPFFILLNLAIGGKWPGYPDETTTFPQELRVDYVRVYALPPPEASGAPSR